MAKNFEIAFQLGAKMDPSMKKTFSNAQKRLGNFGKKMGNVVKTSAKMATGVGTAFVGIGTAAFAMTNKVTSNLDKIAKSSDKLGVSTKAYQEMEYWASQNGISQENMEKAVGRLNQRIGQAAQGNEKYSDALSALGVNMDEVKEGTVSTEDAMYQSISALSEMQNSQEQAAMATELFGDRMARDLMPALQDGSLSLDDARKKAEELGIVIGEDSLNAATKFQDKWDDLKRVFTTTGQKIMVELIPTFQKMMDWVMNNMPAIQEKVSSAMSNAGDVIQKLIDRVRDNMPAIKETVSSAMTTASKMIDKFKNALEWAKDNSDKLVAAGAGVAAMFVSFKIITTVVKAFQAYKKAVAAATIAQRALNIAMATNPIGVIALAIGALVAAGVLLWQNWDTVKEKAGQLWSWLKEQWNNIKNKTLETWDNVKSKIGDAMSSAKTAVSNFFSPLLEFIAKAKGAWDRFKNALSNFSLPSAVGKVISGAGNLVGNLVNGSHANGLANVPFDGYIAELHKGERVLTAEENKKYSSLQALFNNPDGDGNANGFSISTNSSGSPTVAIYPNYELTIYGDANKNDIQQALSAHDKDLDRKFARLMDRYQRNQARLNPRY